jgi:6-pyruvoyltetrahydropterin/6-carboxytetrahydropterin synthase
MTWEVTKTYGHDLGLSCCFRQWKSGSHCRFLHGYTLSFTFVFRRHDDGLDDNHWVIDYGDMKDIRAWLQDNYDHKTMVAQDDPEFAMFRGLHDGGIIDMRVVPRVSTEMFALEAGSFVVDWLAAHHPDVQLVRSEVREHGTNAVVWRPEKDR